MKGTNLVKVPGELYSPTGEGVVVSADGVKDYNQGKTQETINQELVQEAAETREIAQHAADSASSMENIIDTLKQQGEQDIATALEHEIRLREAESNINTLQDQLGNYSIKESSEAEIENLIATDTADANTLYLIPEETEEE